jgi:hypothetical protein
MDCEKRVESERIIVMIICLMFMVSPGLRLVEIIKRMEVCPQWED